MNTYIDTEGVAFQAIQSEAPTLLNTTHGERCAEAGEWIIYPTPESKPTVIDNATFLAAFQRIE
jgi:hypothetical protein